MCTAIILIVIILLGLLLWIFFTKSNNEGLGYPFNKLTFTPQSPKLNNTLVAPYCTNEWGQPVPCPLPCQGRCKTCDWDFPVPVFGPNAGAYSLNKWCPGPPLC